MDVATEKTICDIVGHEWVELFEKPDKVICVRCRAIRKKEIKKGSDKK